MTDIKISEFGAATAFDGTETFEIVQGGVNKKASMLNVVPPKLIKAGNYRWPKLLQAASASALAANVIAFVPWDIDETFTLSELFLSISTSAAGGNVQVALYGSNAAGDRPTGNALVSTASQVTDATGVFSKSVSAWQATPRRVWMAVNSDNSTVVLLAPSTGQAWSTGMIGSATLTNVRSGTTAIAFSITTPQAFNTWPDVTSASFTEATNNKCGVLGHKVSSVP